MKGVRWVGVLVAVGIAAGTIAAALMPARYRVVAAVHIEATPDPDITFAYRLEYQLNYLLLSVVSHDATVSRHRENETTERWTIAVDAGDTDTAARTSLRLASSIKERADRTKQPFGVDGQETALAEDVRALVAVSQVAIESWARTHEGKPIPTAMLREHESLRGALFELLGRNKPFYEGPRRLSATIPLEARIVRTPRVLDGRVDPPFRSFAAWGAAAGLCLGLLTLPPFVWWRGVIAGCGASLARKKTWLPAAFGLAGTLAGALALAMAPDTYRASATILAVRRTPLPESYMRPAMREPDDRLGQIARSSLLEYKIAPIVLAYGLYASEPNWESAVGEMHEHIAMTIDHRAAEPDPKSELRFALAFDATEARTAVAVTGQLAALFLDLNERPPEAPDAIDLVLEKQADVLRARLLKAEAGLEASRSSNPGRRDPAGLLREYQRLQDEYSTLLRQNEDRHIAPFMERRALGETLTIVDAPHLTGVDSPAAAPFLMSGAAAGAAAGLALALVLRWRRTT